MLDLHGGHCRIQQVGVMLYGQGITVYRLKHFFRYHIILKDCIHPNLTSQAFFRGILPKNINKKTTDDTFNSWKFHQQQHHNRNFYLDHGQENWCSYSEYWRTLIFLCEPSLMFYLQYGMKYFTISVQFWKDTVMSWYRILSYPVRQ